MYVQNICSGICNNQNISINFHFDGVVESDSPLAFDSPPDGFQRFPERLQSSAGCSREQTEHKQWPFRGTLTGNNLRRRKVWEEFGTHNDAWVISCHGDVVRARGRDQTHGQDQEGQSQQGHGHPQGRLPPAQVLGCRWQDSVVAEVHMHNLVRTFWTIFLRIFQRKL